MLERYDFVSIGINSYFFIFKYHTNGEDSYSVGTLGYTDVDCDYIDFTYVSIDYQEKFK